MKYTPALERETFYLPNFLMDNVIVFAMSGLIAFIIPLFTARRASHEQVEKVLSLYNQHQNTAVLRNICMGIGAAVAIYFCISRLNKFHIYSFELDGACLRFFSYNLRGKERIREIDVAKTPVKYIEIDETMERDSDIRISDHNNQLILSTETSKYWNFQKDKNKLRAFKEQLMVLKSSM